MIFLHYFTFLLRFYHSIRSTLFFSSHLLQISSTHSSVVHSELKTHNVFCRKIKCKLNWCNIASVQNNYLWMITSKNSLERRVNITFWKNCSNFFFSASFHWACVYICLDFQKKKLLTVTSERRKYFIHSDHH